MRTNLFYFVFYSFFILNGNYRAYAQDIKPNIKNFPSKTQNDSTVIGMKDFKINKDTSKTKKQFLTDKVHYIAKDYAKINQKNKTITLYNKAELYYTDIELKAGIIVLNYDKSEVYAGRIKDSTGKYTQIPVFKQGQNIVEPDSIRFNFKTKKALVWNSRTEQNEFRVKAEITKRENDSVYFMKKARFTTAKDIEDPEYYFQTYKVKFVPGKKIVTGLTNLVIANVPTPLALPFAFFPMTKDNRASGIIIPTYSDNSNRGYSLQNFGYYFNLNPHYDLALTADYYTNGGYALRSETAYAWRYKFRGNLNLRFENLVTGERGFPGYSRGNSYNFQWSHSKDSKSSPNSSFSASVNMGSSKFFQNTISQRFVASKLNNTLSSSISYTKRFNSVPQVNLSLNATQSQNTQTQSINMTLPSLTLSVDRIFPFAKDDEPKKGLIKNINFQYSMTGRNEINTTDSLFFKPQMFKDAKVGMQHSIPVSSNFKLFKYFSVPLTMNFNEVWYLKTIRKNFESNQAKVLTTEVNQFDRYNTYSFSTGLGTTIYGMFKFNEKKKLQAIRHVMTPNVSYSYTPSFKKYYDSYAIDATGTKREDYSRFENGIYSAPGKTMSNNIGFSLGNTFEAKMTDKDSTKVEPKKVMLLNSLNFQTSYDMTAESFKLSPVQVSGGTTLFDQKLGINFGATLDPYALDNRNNRIEKWNKDNGGSLFRLSSANVTMNYSLRSKENKDVKKDDKSNVQNGGRGDDLFGKNAELSDQRKSLFDDEKSKGAEEKPDAFFNSKIKWDMTFAYSLTYSNTRRENSFANNSLMISGNLDLTPKWKIGASTGYDFANNDLTFTNLRMERDLLSWRMSFNWVPFGTYTSWGFFIGIKSSVLSDIKWEKNNAPDTILK